MRMYGSEITLIETDYLGHGLRRRGLGLRPLAATKRLKNGSCESGECFSPPPFFSPPQFLAKAAKSGLRRKTKGQKFLFEKKSHNILRINRLQLTVLKNTHKKQEVDGL